MVGSKVGHAWFSAFYVSNSSVMVTIVGSQVSGF